MNTQAESKQVFVIPETELKGENPMQERHCDEVRESVELTAEAIFTARQHETRGEAGPVFVP